MRKGQSIIVPIFLVLFVMGIIVVLAGIDTVRASHYGVVEEFGKITGVQEPGMKWTGIFAHVEKYDLRTQKVVVELQGDNNAVDETGQKIFATINVNYRIKRSKDTVRQLYENVGRSKDVSNLLNLDAIIAEGFKQTTVKYEALDIIVNQQEVKELTKERVRSNFPTQYFEIESIIVTNIDFTEEFKQSIEAKKIAVQDSLTEKNKLEIVRFQQEQKVLVYEAEATKMRLQSKEVTSLLNQQKWIEKWNGELPQYMIASGSTSEYILQIPTIEQPTNTTQ